jgi:hypothetical protein
VFCHICVSSSAVTFCREQIKVKTKLKVKIKVKVKVKIKIKITGTIQRPVHVQVKFILEQAMKAQRGVEV